ncbi:MAG: DUF2975 domain-containing protein [Alphaproteobacteria bacterium]|uniref:DUF2975 domain-containing protein n=1 Tax=Hyphomonas sp. TaxID=87 RepID=UPI001DEFDB56|nr:DUF2975 domain-containing protein [Hyphomonas sp.]MBU3920207.1 DUF2975 domain-containing protein [Alphaproteobacteria bacterium]MBU4063261.1 DUF2975 domain-containing protein [Alphaproteobacteria bacterium]MBU4164079.1 DUF2975 domain-containing protein [Alphaproteobacteria bacterium]MBU4569043.1 DUF2975 domain-containing protein [Alphaproteobacteria bacterium]
MPRPQTPDTPAPPLRETSWLSVAAIVLIVVLLLSVLADIGARVSGSVVTGQNWTGVLNAFLLAQLVNLPTFIFIGVLGDFASLFGRTGEGEVFTARNLKTLRSAGHGLIWAAAASSLIVPTVLSWTTGDGRGFIWDVNDLALGTGAMGCALLGLVHVFAEGIRLKADSDQII